MWRERERAAADSAVGESMMDSGQCLCSVHCDHVGSICCSPHDAMKEQNDLHYLKINMYVGPSQNRIMAV